MTHKNHHDDRKLLFAVAGLVVAGAAGLALLAGMGQDANPSAARRSAGAPKVARSTPPAPAVAAVRVEPVEVEAPGDVMPAKLGGSTVDADVIEAAEELAGRQIGVSPTAVEAAAARFAIEPGANLVTGGLTAWNARDYVAAVAYFGAQSDAKPDDGWALYMLGLSLWKGEALDAAVDALTRSAQVTPGFVKSHVNLARVQNERGQFEDALAASERALEIDESNAEALFLKGRSLRNLARTDEALAALEASVQSDDSNGYVHNLIGLIRIEQGNAADAVESLRLAAELAPRVSYVRNNLGMALERSGDAVGAIAAYRAAVELDGGHDGAMRNLARLEPLVPATDEDTSVVMAQADTDGHE